jgi:hypothetical protein
MGFIVSGLLSSLLLASCPAFHGSNHQIRKLATAIATTRQKIRGHVQNDFFSSLLRLLIGMIRLLKIAVENEVTEVKSDQEHHWKNNVRRLS